MRLHGAPLSFYSPLLTIIAPTKPKLEKSHPRQVVWRLSIVYGNVNPSAVESFLKAY